MMEEVAVKRPLDPLDQDLAGTLDTGSSSSCLSFFLFPLLLTSYFGTWYLLHFFLSGLEARSLGSGCQHSWVRRGLPIVNSRVRLMVDKLY